MSKEDLKEQELNQEQETQAEGQASEPTDNQVQADDQEAQEEVKAIEMTDEERLTVELQEAKDKYLRLYSEFENFRRRTAKERLELIKTATEDLMVNLLPVLDDFERAGKSFDDEKTDKKSMAEGVQLISNKLKKALENKGLKPMDSDAGIAFDADKHEAITKIPAPEEKLKGKVVDVVEKGYYLDEKVIRFAKVVIGE